MLRTDVRTTEDYFNHRRPARTSARCPSSSPREVCGCGNVERIKIHYIHLSKDNLRRSGAKRHGKRSTRGEDPTDGAVWQRRFCEKNDGRVWFAKKAIVLGVLGNHEYLSESKPESGG